MSGKAGRSPCVGLPVDLPVGRPARILLAVSTKTVALGATSAPAVALRVGIVVD